LVYFNSPSAPLATLLTLLCKQRLVCDVKSLYLLANLEEMRLTVSHIFFLPIVFAVVLALTSCRNKKQLVDSGEKKEVAKTSPVQEIVGISKKELKNSKLYSFIDEWYASPYKYGGCMKTGIDCSCFTSMLYDKVYGIKTPRTAGELYKESEKIKTHQLKEGDLLFFIINGKNVSHVGVYLKNDLFVHASTSKGVIINSLNDTYYKKNFYAAGRLRHSS
jgi:murein DD-endopeptidase / murein LD-carboxypeptidase